MRTQATTNRNADRKTVKRLLELLGPLVKSRTITNDYAVSFAQELAGRMGPRSREELRKDAPVVRQAILALPDLAKILNEQPQKNQGHGGVAAPAV